MVFSFLKKSKFKEIERISEQRSSERAARELGINVSYKEAPDNHILPKEYFKIVVVDFKNVSDSTKIKFEELQEEYQHQEYQKLVKALVKKVLLYSSVLTALCSTLILAKCEKEKNSSEPKLIQKAILKKENTPYPARLRDG